MAVKKRVAAEVSRNVSKKKAKGTPHKVAVARSLEKSRGPKR